MQPPAALSKWQSHFSDILNDRASSQEEGFSIYKGDFIHRFNNKLTDYYPLLPLLLGKECWEKEISFPFIKENLPRSWKILDWVKELPQWLLKQKITTPLLFAMAECEKMIMEAFFSDSLPLPNAETLETVRFKLQPYVRFLNSSYPLKSYREMLLSGEKIVEPIVGNYLFLFYQNAMGDVLMDEIGEDEKAFLQAADNRTMEEILLYFYEKDPAYLESIIPKIPLYTRRWIDLSLISYCNDFETQ